MAQKVQLIQTFWSWFERCQNWFKANNTPLGSSGARDGEEGTHHAAAPLLHPLSSQEACSLAHPVTQDHEQQEQRRGEELGAAAPTQAKGILSKAIKERVHLPVANSRKWRLVFSLGWGGWAVSELSLTSCNGGRQVGTS